FSKTRPSRKSNPYQRKAQELQEHELRIFQSQIVIYSDLLFRIIQSIHPKVSTGSAFGRKSSQSQPNIPTKGTQGTLESNDQSAEENINEQAHPIQNSILKNDPVEK